MQHAAAVVDEKLYIVGGSRNGRYLSDVQVSLILCLLYLFNGSVFDLLNSSTCQVFDLRSLTWDSLKLKTEDGDGSLGEAFPAISDHRMVKFFYLHKSFCNHILEMFKKIVKNLGRLSGETSFF